MQRQVSAWGRQLRTNARTIGRDFGGGVGDGLREQFPRGLASVGDRIKSWGRGLGAQGRDIGRGLGDQLNDGVKSGVGMLGGTLRGGTKLLAGFAAGGVAALGLVAGAAVVMGTSVASANEQATISFTTMLRKAGDTEAEARGRAKAFIGDLQRLAATTPFEFADLQAYSSKLVSAGVEVDKIIPMMRNLGDVTSGVGTGAEGINRATVALQQMIAAGRIQAEDLNQLRDAGIPVYDLLAGATGKSKKEVAELAQTGKLGKKELDQLLDTLSSDAPKGLEKFSGLMGKQSTSLKGMWSNLTDTVSQGLGRVGSKAMPQLKRTLSGLSNVLGDVFDYLDDHGDDLERIFRAGGDAVKSFGGIIRPVLSAFTGGVTDGQDGLKALADWLDTHQEDITGFFVGMVDGAIGFGTAVGNAVSFSLRAYASLSDAIGKVLEVVLAANQKIMETAATAADAVGAHGTADGLRSGAAKIAELRANNKGDDAGASSARAMADAIDNKLLPGLAAANEALDKYGKRARDAAASSDAWQTALQGVGRSVEENGRSLSSHTKAGKANRKSIKDAVEALNEDAVAAGRNAYKKGTLKDAEKAAAKVMRDGTRDLKDQTKKAGLNEDAVGKMIREQKKQPKEMKTAITFSTNANKVLAKLVIKGAMVGVDAAKDVFKTAAGGLAGRFMGQLPGRTPLSRGDDMQLPILGGGRQHLRGGEGVQVTEAMDPYEVRRLNAMNHGVNSGLSPARVRDLLGEADDRVSRAARGGIAGNGAVLASAGATGPAAASFAAREAERTAAAYAAVTRKALQGVLDAARAVAAGGGNGGYSGPVGAGASGIRKIASSYKPSYIAGHRDPQGRPAFDIGSSGQKNTNIGNALRVNHGKLGLRYVIRQMQIASAKSGWGWRGYTPISGAGDFRHVAHVHASYARGGIVPKVSAPMSDLAQALSTGRGYANGTTSARAGFHWTGEKDAELVVNPQLRRYSGGEKVLQLGKGSTTAGGRPAPTIGTINFNGRDGVRSELQELHFGVRTLQVGRK